MGRESEKAGSHQAQCKFDLEERIEGEKVGGSILHYHTDKEA